MNIYAGVDPEAQQLVREHRGVFGRLPWTFLVNTLVDIQKWSKLFEPERRHFRALFDQLSALDASQFDQMFRDLARFEAEAGLKRAEAGELMTAQAEVLKRLRSKGAYLEWRRIIDAIFEKLEPMVEARLYSSARSRSHSARLSDRAWSRSQLTP
jgi:hypothetical protein